MARMNVDTPLLQEPNRQILVRTRRGDPQHRTPAALYLQPGDTSLRGQLAVKLREVPARAFDDLFLESVPQFHKFGDCQLHRRIHGKIRVRDYFEARERCTLPFLRPAGD